VAVRSRLLILFLIAIVPLQAEAKIFLRWGTRARVGRTMETLGGKQVYEAEISLNEGRGDLRIYAFDRSALEVGRDLEKAFETSGLTGRRASMAFATVRLRGVVLRIVVLDLADGDQTLVFAIEQSASEFKRSASPPENGSVGGIPPYPGSRALFKADDENTGMAFVVSEVQASAENVREFYLSRLVADGWDEAVSPVTKNTPAGIRPGSSPSLGLYLKPGKVCCVLAEENGFPKVTRITIVHKTQLVK